MDDCPAQQEMRIIRFLCIYVRTYSKEKNTVSSYLIVRQYTTWNLETRFTKETEMVFGNFEGKDVRSGSFTVEPF